MGANANIDSSIDEVSRATGIGKDTLRAWERRYGFPAPHRNQQGLRLYPEQQLDRLRIICRLLDQGYRPGKVVKLSAQQLEQLSHQIQPTDPAPACAAIQQLISVVRSGNASQLALTLEQRLQQQGARQFVLDTAAPLLEQTGNAWAKGELPIYAEHLITQQLKRTLSRACDAIEISSKAPRVLLTTVPGESHSMGLAMVELLLRLEGFAPMSLGVETPEEQMIQACIELQPQALLLSFSLLQKRATVVSALTELSSRLPASVLLLAGGKGVEKLRSLPARVRVIKKLEQLAAGLTPVLPATEAHLRA